MMAPTTFGKYVVTEMLGSGGMAEVYAGIHPELGRKVAIKVILPQFATESSFEERFRREARLVASLRHPHIVQVYDFDVVDGRYFMVMEYLEGDTLKNHLRALHQQKVQMPLSEVAGLIEAMAGALDYAHSRGAIHRDIKPANILFTADRDPVLTDFGIAKLLEDAARLTATGGIVGSPFYMPPEQATGGAVDGRSDQYSLGVVLYEMTTGRLPFQGSSAVAVMTQHLNNAPPPPRSVNGALPFAVEAVLLKVLAKDPNDRFDSSGELAQAFRQAVEGRGSIALPASPADDNARTILSSAPPDSSIDPPGVDAASVDASVDATVVSVDALAPVSGAERAADKAGREEVAPAPRGEPPQAALLPAKATDQPPVPSNPSSLPSLPAGSAREPSDESRLPAVPPPAPPKPTTQTFNVGGIQAGIVNQGGEQSFTGDLTFNLDFGEIKAAPPQQELPGKAAAAGRDDHPEFAALLEALRRAFAGSARVDRFVRLVTQFHTQLEALPAERAGERNQVVKRVQALLMEMSEAKPDPDLVEIMGTSLQRAVQPLSAVDPDLPTLATRITSWVELMIQPE